MLARVAASFASSPNDSHTVSGHACPLDARAVRRGPVDGGEERRRPSLHALEFLRNLRAVPLERAPHILRLVSQHRRAHLRDGRDALFVEEPSDGVDERLRRRGKRRGGDVRVDGQQARVFGDDAREVEAGYADARAEDDETGGEERSVDADQRGGRFAVEDSRGANAREE